MELYFYEDDSVAQKFLIAYYYASPHDWERIEAFRALSGDSEKNLITQYVRGWLGKNRDYYLELAQRDAIARNLSFRAWGETVVRFGVDELPPYQEEISIPLNPLRDVTLSSDTIRRPLNYILLGTQNLALLRIGIHHDRDTAIGFVSRIVKEHLDRNWDRLYAPQVEAEDFETWK
jgi:hypothetical protein